MKTKKKLSILARLLIRYAPEAVHEAKKALNAAKRKETTSAPPLIGE